MSTTNHIKNRISETTNGTVDQRPQQYQWRSPPNHESYDDRNGTVAPIPKIASEKQTKKKKNGKLNNDLFLPLHPQPPTALQLHISFWDRDNDSIINPRDVYTGFRELGFGYFFSLGSLLINLFFSYPTRLAHSYIPDPFFRIYVDSIHKAKHGSDTGVYDSNGGFRPQIFEDLFAQLDREGVGGLGVEDLIWLLKKDRVAADPAGWSFAFMEWWTTWLLLQRDGRVWKEDLRALYDGSLFWQIREERMQGRDVRRGYGPEDFFKSIVSNGTWRSWEK